MCKHKNITNLSFNGVQRYSCNDCQASVDIKPIGYKSYGVSRYINIGNYLDKSFETNITISI